ncbi:nucleotidyltransferase domain-containing protein [Pantoea sp. CS_6]|uniref:nucleotidyltransferase domain-containing protein n=1 Tax=Pantoea sp. CS_6 TaxID=3055795 RepID=UPI0035BF0A3A
MALDAEGYIAVPPVTAFQPAFQAIVDDTLHQLRLTVGDDLHSLWLYGSVAFGTAVEGQSDLDVCLVFRHPLAPATRDSLAAVKERLTARHPVVSKIDVDKGTLSEVMDPNNLNTWGYWLKHHCRCLYGEDLSVRFNRFRPSKALARALNGNFTKVLDEYVAKLSCALPGRQLWQRAAARKVIRSTNMLRQDSDADWPATLAEHVSRFVLRYPDQEAAIAFFLAESYQPGASAREFISQLDAFRGWLVQQLEQS